VKKTKKRESKNKKKHLFYHISYIEKQKNKKKGQSKNKKKHFFSFFPKTTKTSL